MFEKPSVPTELENLYKGMIILINDQLVVAGIFKSQCFYQRSDLRHCSVLNCRNCIIFLISGYHRSVLYQVQLYNHSSPSLVITPQMKCQGDGGSPLFCLQQVHTVNTAIIPTYTARKDIFVLSAICTSRHARCRMRVNELPPLCNCIRDQQTWVYERPVCN